MTRTMYAAMTALLLATALAGCDEQGRAPAPLAPSAAQPTPQPQPSQPHRLSASASVVGPGGLLDVSWSAPRGGAADWIGLFSVGAANCDHGWTAYTLGASVGAISLNAPALPGQFEFRYHLEDGCEEAARSSVVTVTAGG